MADEAPAYKAFERNVFTERPRHLLQLILMRAGQVRQNGQHGMNIFDQSLALLDERRRILFNFFDHS